MKEKLIEIATLFDSVMDLIIQNKTDELVLKINEIKSLIRNAIESEEKSLEKKEELEPLKEKITNLEKRLGDIENMTLPSSQLQEEGKKWSIWNF